MTTPTLALIVPCYNEAGRLNEQAFVDCVQSRPEVFLLFVDDGSTDRTRDVLQRIERSAPGRVGVLALERNRGKAEAVRLGVQEAWRRHPDLVGFWDADLSTPLWALGDFLRVAADRPDVDLVIGSRILLMGRDIRRTAWRHYLGRVFATAASMTLALPVYDTQCGAKVFRATDAVAPVFETPFRSAWIFDVEILARYLAMPVGEGEPARRARIYELALPAWHEVPGSKVKLFDFVRSMFELLAIRRDQRTWHPVAPGRRQARESEGGLR